MKKKTIIICIIVAIAVFAASLTAALFIFNGNKDSDYSLASDNSPESKELKSELKACKTPEDYYALARQYVDDNKLFYANEIIREGYCVTGDKSLDIAVITGKPTLESTIIGLSLDNIPDSVHYYLGRSCVISTPCYSGMSRYNTAAVYEFDSSTHRIKAIEMSNMLSYDKLDKDLRNIAIANDSMPILFNEYNIDEICYSANMSEAIELSKHNASVPLSFTYQVCYRSDGKISGMRCGDKTIKIDTTETGYDVTMPNVRKIISSDKVIHFQIDMQEDHIMRLINEDYDYSEVFNYSDDSSYTLTVNRNDHSTKLSYNKDNLLTEAERNGSKVTYSYNSRQLLNKMSVESPKQSESYDISYIDDLYIANFLDHLFYSYDDDGRIVKISGDDFGDAARSFTYDQHGRIDQLSGAFQSYTNLNDDTIKLSYDSEGVLCSITGKDSAITYNIIHDENGLLTGISQQDADIWTLEENKLYPGIGELDKSKVYITDSQVDQLSFVVRDATKEDCESYVQSYKDAGYTVYLASDEDSMGYTTGYEYRLLDNKDHPTKAVIITFKETTEYYYVKVYDFETYFSDAEQFLFGEKEFVDISGN